VSFKSALLVGVAGVVMGTAALPAAAQDVVAAPPAPPTTAEEGVLTFAPDYFAALRPNTALEMVQRLPGFQIDSGDQVRGFAGAAGNVLIDGRRPTTKNDRVSDILGRIPAGQVERIELIRGAVPGIDMQGRTVVVNVVRKKGDTFEHSAAVGTHVFFGTGKTIPAWRYDASWRSGERTLDFSLVRGANIDDSVGEGRRITVYPDGRPTLDEHAFNEGDGWAHTARVNFKSPFAGGAFAVNGNVTADTFKSETDFSSAGSFLDTVGRSANERAEVGANWVRPLGRTLELEILGLQKLGQGDFRGDTRRPGSSSRFMSAYENGESIGRAILRYKHGPKLDLELAAEGAFNFRETSVSLQQNGATVALPGADVRVEEKRGEAEAKASWRPATTLSLEAGVRYERSTITQSGEIEKERSFTYPKPRLQATWSPTAAHQLRVLVERQVGQLDFGDFASSTNLNTGVLTAGNAELEPDTTWVYEAAYERRFWGKGALVLTYTRGEVSGLIDLKSFPVDTNGDGVADDAVVGVGNIGDARFDEVELELTLPLDRLGLTGVEFSSEVELFRSEVRDPTTGEARAFSDSRPDEVELAIRQDLPAHKLSWRVGYYAGWEEDSFRLDEVEHLQIRNFWSATIEYKPSQKTTFTAEFMNLDPFVFERSRTVYKGSRLTEPVDFFQTYETQSQRRAYFRLRRVLG
jgi:hypothetical protein